MLLFIKLVFAIERHEIPTSNIQNVLIMSLTRRLAVWFKWPTFLAAVLSLYYSVALIAATYRLKWLNFTGRRNDVLGW